MTTINNLSIEQMREIVDGAPEGATHFNKTECGYAKQIRVISMGFAASTYSLACLKSKKDETVCLNDLRTAIAKHDSQAFKIGDHIRYMGIDRKTPHPEIFKVVGFDSMPGGGDGYKIKNCLGQIDFCYGDNYVLVDCDATDHVTDIRNHVSPSTLVWDLASGEDWTAEAERHG